MDWAWSGFLSHRQLSSIYSKKAPRNWIPKTWHVIKAYIHLNAWKPQCEDVSREGCQRRCKLDHYALSHPKEQSWLSDRICSMQHHSVSMDGAAMHYGDKYSYYNCIKLFVRVVLMYQLCSERTISTSLGGKVWNALVCTYQQHLLLNKLFVLHAWICTCDYPTSFIILMASTRCWGGG